MNTQYLHGTGTLVKGFTKKRLQSTVHDYISTCTPEGKYLVCTDTQNNLRQLFLKKLHKNVMRNRNIYICSGDFVDADDVACTIYFTLVKNDDGFYVKEAEVHFLFTEDSDCINNDTFVLKVA